jgi:hypothetical protein
VSNHNSGSRTTATPEPERLFNWGQVILIDESDVVGRWLDGDLSSKDLEAAFSSNACYIDLPDD